jgi:hypothetical protein
MNAIELLKHQHLQIERLLWKVQHSRRTKSQRVFFEELANRLTAHLALEDGHFNGALAAKMGDHGLAQSLDEHREIAGVVAALRASLGDPDVFDAEFEVLRELIVRHHGQEEEKLFPNARLLFSPGELEALGEDMTLEAARTGAAA